MTPSIRTAGLSVALLLSISVLLGCTSTGSDTSATTTSQPSAEPPTSAGTGQDANRQPYVDAFASAYESDGDVLMSPAQSQCLGGGYVDVIGLDQLRTADITPEAVAEGGGGLDDLDIDEETATELYEQFAACDIDPQEIYISLAEAFLDGPVTAEQRTCLEGVLTEDNLRRSFVADATGEDLDPDPLDAADDCAPLSLAPSTPEGSVEIPPSTTTP